MRGLLKARLNKLEAGLPDEAEQQQMRARIERARNRIMAAMAPDERAEYLAKRLSGRTKAVAGLKMDGCEEIQVAALRQAKDPKPV